jgi:two-component system cell cycle response regulator
LKILIAEDDAVSRTILQRSVEKFRHERLVAEDGEKAWKLYWETPEVDVISAWMMPGIDSLEFCRLIPLRPSGGRRGAPEGGKHHSGPPPER